MQVVDLLQLCRFGVCLLACLGDDPMIFDVIAAVIDGPRYDEHGISFLA
ncbi:hypothetical protein HGG76_11705 [Ochrobactrum tritici]|uniref:Uncharacterized protein n=1 Tax=Brucella tritici TaxID=94626 RepID=A0A7X6FQF7_9HYPH|nr:hypothetical protein [Brucella tritici]